MTSTVAGVLLALLLVICFNELMSLSDNLNISSPPVCSAVITGNPGHYGSSRWSLLPSPSLQCHPETCSEGDIPNHTPSPGCLQTRLTPCLCLKLQQSPAAKCGRSTQHIQHGHAAPECKGQCESMDTLIWDTFSTRTVSPERGVTA